tara:strand:- start:1377 stop:1544 length:168 start_codon:yes stop_codon:yes gene_type:complete
MDRGKSLIWRRKLIKKILEDLSDDDRYEILADSLEELNSDIIPIATIDIWEKPNA